MRDSGLIDEVAVAVSVLVILAVAKDWPFDCVTGRTANGWIEWKDQQGRTLGERKQA